jgi:hypothetical protein
MDEELYMPHQRLLAMMRAIDNDRNGQISFREFKKFAEAAVEDLEDEQSLLNTANARPMYAQDPSSTMTKEVTAALNVALGIDRLDNVSVEEQIIDDIGPPTDTVGLAVSKVVV